MVAPTLTDHVLSPETLTYLREVERLEELMPCDGCGNIKAADAAKALGWSVRTVRDSMHRYNAAERAGDEPTMRVNVPCTHTGELVEHGSGKYGRWTINRAAFINWLLRGWRTGELRRGDGEGEAA